MIERGGGLYLLATKYGGKVSYNATDPEPVHRGRVEAGGMGV